MDGKFDDVKPVNGKKLLFNLAWGCLLFILVMSYGTKAIGSYFGAKIKARVDQENAVAAQRLAKERDARYPSNQVQESPKATSTNSESSPSN